MNRDIWAKSKNSILLKDHIDGMRNQARLLKEILNLDDKVYRILKLAILIHDLGKVSPSFQIEVGNYNYFPKVPFPNIPHSIFSLFWIKTEELGLDKRDISILLSAIAFHHWRSNFHQILLGQDKSARDAAKILLENIRLRTELKENLEVNLREILKYFCIRETSIDFNEVIADSISNGDNVLNLLFPPYLIYFLPYRSEKDFYFKRENILISGLLMRLDHFTSYIQEERVTEIIERGNVLYKDVKVNLKNRLQSKIGKELSDEEIWQISEIDRLGKHGEKRQNIILISPTGSGKTEFAFLWGSDRKIIFTLPLRSAANSIFLRASKIFGEENVGLLHSDADIYIQELKEKSYEESLRVLEFSRQLSLPVLISTGDQIFPSALKYPGYEKIYATLGYANLIIDEVQAYDPRASAIVIKLIEDIINLGGSFLLMTATLPSFIKDEIEKRIGEDNFVYIDRYENLPKEVIKHELALRIGDIEDENVLKEIISKAKARNRILVIANTVEKSQCIFEKLDSMLSEDSISLSLLHSRFTLEDRKNKESELIEKDFKNPKEKEEDGKILVATQVVEASLDIDADYLYTEIAPIDALVQRMGRVLRRIKNDKDYLYNGDPNINIFFNVPKNKESIESGKGLVYHNDLLTFTLLILLKKVGVIEEEEISRLKKDYKESENSYKKARDKIFSVLGQKLNNGRGFVFKLKLNEREKKPLVESLYKILPENSGYIKSFYDTLNILDSGYVSEKRSEALRIFREIYTVPAIPTSLGDQFLDTLKCYIENKEINYVSFRKEILSKFCVNIDIRRYLRDGALNLETATSLLGEITFKTQTDKLEKVIHWLSDIYIIKGEYCPKVGLKLEKA